MKNLNDVRVLKTFRRFQVVVVLKTFPQSHPGFFLYTDGGIKGGSSDPCTHNAESILKRISPYPGYPL